MPMEASVVLAGVIVVVIVTVAFAIRKYRQRDARGPHHELRMRANAALEESMPPGLGTHLEQPIEMVDIAVVDGESLVPIVGVPLGTTDAVGMELVFGYVTDVLDAISPVFEDERVHHYDVQFLVGPSGLLVSGECRRVSVPPELVERLQEDRYRAHDLHRDVEAGTHGSVLWEDCRTYSSDGC